MRIFLLYTLLLSFSFSLEFSDFIGTWNGNITNDQTWSYDDAISIIIQSDNSYSVPNNPGGHLVSDLYPGTEEVYFNSSTNILTFQWVQYYHYACGGGCYVSSTFEVMELEDGELILYYNNGSGPAPQANSMFLSLDEECVDGEMNFDDPCMPEECYNNQWYQMVIDCAEPMGFPCEGGEYLPPTEGECCSVCIVYGDVNSDSQINVLDVVQLVNFILGINNPDDSEILVADISGDGSLNVLDVVALVNIILTN